MYGFTTTLSDVSFDQVLQKTVEKVQVKAVADAAEHRLRRVCFSLGGTTSST